MSTTLTKNEEEEIEKAQTKVNKVTLNEYKAERLYQLKKFIKAQLNIPEHFKGETLQQALQKIDSSHLKQLVQQFDRLYPQKQSFSNGQVACSPRYHQEFGTSNLESAEIIYKKQREINSDEKENCQVQRGKQSQHVKENCQAAEPKQKVQIKILNELLHKLAANSKNGGAASQLVSSSNLNGKVFGSKGWFNLKPKSFISPKKSGKYSMLGKRSSMAAFSQAQKENQNSAQPIYQPIPKRSKQDSPSFQALGSEPSEKSSGGSKPREQVSESLRNLVK